MYRIKNPGRIPNTSTSSGVCHCAPRDKPYHKCYSMKNVAAMVGSFHYSVCIELMEGSHIRAEDGPVLEHGAEVWYRNILAVFPRPRLGTMKDSGIMSNSREELSILPGCFPLNAAAHEPGREINNHPQRWSFWSGHSDISLEGAS